MRVYGMHEAIEFANSALEKLWQREAAEAATAIAREPGERRLLAAEPAAQGVGGGGSGGGGGGGGGGVSAEQAAMAPAAAAAAVLASAAVAEAPPGSENAPPPSFIRKLAAGVPLSSPSPLLEGVDFEDLDVGDSGAAAAGAARAAPRASPHPPSSAPLHASATWDDVVPEPGAAPLLGGFALVFRGGFRKQRGVPLAVKILKVSQLPSGELAGAVAGLQAEAASIVAASASGGSEFVVNLYGLVRGAPSSAWRAALGDDLGLVLSRAEGAATAAPSREMFGLIFRWEEGGSLAELLHARVWGATTAQRLTLCAQLAWGLAVIHANGIVHGDCKPENVLLSDKGPTPRPRFSDFGLATLRASRDSVLSSVRGAEEKRGTWRYMAPEMLLEKDDGSPPDCATGSSDVYALGALCWEALAGKKPWGDFTEQRRMRLLTQGKQGGPATQLGTPPLPDDTPAVVRALLGACLAEVRAARPRAAQVAEALHQAAQEMASGVFDVFLSHAWADGVHVPLTTEVYLRLLDAGLRVWLDKTEMGHDMVASMTGGIAKSGCVVALLTERYGTRPNCLLELRAARDAGKPVVACLADAAPGWFPAAGSEMAELVGTAQHLMPDLRAAAAVDWRADVSAAEREALTKAPAALPKVLQLVREVLRGRGGGGATPPGSP